jgi:hypothetical protein
MRVRIDRSGWCVFSSTIEEVPGRVGKLVSFGSGGEVYEVVTEFDDDGELAGQLAHVDGHCVWVCEGARLTPEELAIYSL